MTSTTRLKGLGALAAGLPDLVGDDAAGSVLVLFESRGSLAGVLGWADDAPEREVARMLDVVAQRRATMQAESAIAIAYRCEPGAVDIDAVAARIERRVPLHHVLTVSEEHWWVVTCTVGCCDGAIREIPPLLETTRGRLRSVRTEGTPGSEAPLTPALLTAAHEAWSVVRAVPATAGSAIRRAHSAELKVLADTIAHAQVRDHLLASIAPELCMFLAPHARQDADGPTMTSAQLQRWLPHVPRHGRAAWKALEAAAYWREGDRGASCAASALSLRLLRTPLAELLHDIVGTGLTYERAVEQTSARTGAAFFA